MKEYYKVLGLKNNATHEDIKRAYLHLSSKIHPDKGGNEYLFGKVKEAYEILSNKENKNYKHRTLTLTPQELGEIPLLMNTSDKSLKIENKRKKYTFYD
jgi:curved DNA-binding protein CbpA